LDGSSCNRIVGSEVASSSCAVVMAVAVVTADNEVVETAAAFDGNGDVPVTDLVEE
jgi:hypothetical protein